MLHKPHYVEPIGGTQDSPITTHGASGKVPTQAIATFPPVTSPKQIQPWGVSTMRSWGKHWPESLWSSLSTSGAPEVRSPEDKDRELGKGSRLHLGPSLASPYSSPAWGGDMLCVPSFTC